MHRARRLRQFPALKRRQNERPNEQHPGRMRPSPYVAAAPAATLTTKRSGPLLLGCWKRRGLRPPVEHRPKQQPRAREGGEQLTPNGVSIGPVRFDAEFELLRLGGRHVERSE